MLARKFHMCTPDVKISLFKTYCTTLYTAHLWCDFSESKMKKLQVAYNDALRIVLKILRRSSASEMFVSNNVPTFNAVLRNCMYRFMCRLIGSKNMIIVSMADVSKSDTRYTSCFWKQRLRACMFYKWCLIWSFLNVLYCLFMFIYIYICIVLSLWTFVSWIKSWLILLSNDILT